MTAERAAGWFLAGVGAGVAALWAGSLPGAFRRGLFTSTGTPETGTIPAFHLVAEAAMAATSLGAGVALLSSRPHAREAALSASGMLVYSSINSSGWLLRNQPPVAAVTGSTLVGSLAVIRVLLRSPTSRSPSTGGVRTEEQPDTATRSSPWPTSAKR